MTDEKTPILVDTTVKSDESSGPQKIDVIPEARISERPYSTRKNNAIVNEPGNNSKKQSISEPAADIKVSLMVICCPCPEPKCKESDKCDKYDNCDKCENCDCKESDKCNCENCNCENCECKKTNKCEKPDKSCCVDHFPLLYNLCTCYGMGIKDIVQTHPQINK